MSQDEVPAHREEHPEGLVQHPGRPPAAAPTGHPSRNRRADRARTTSRRSSPWPSSARRSARSAGSRSPSPSATSTGSGVRRRSSARAGSSRRSIRPRTSTTSTRASRPPARTSRTPPSRRPSTTRKRASRASRPRPAPASGAARWRWPATSSTSSAKSTWCKVSYEQKPYRRSIMQTFGAARHAEPLRPDERRPGGARAGPRLARLARASPSRRRSRWRPRAAAPRSTALGSVLNHVLMHQTVIGLEALEQIEMAGEYPDVVIGCVGGGSNFAGFALPFVRKNLTERQEDARSSRSSRTAARA